MADDKLKEINLNLSISYLSSFYIGSGVGDNKRVDNTVVKNSNGLPYIPGSSIKGRVKYNLNKILNSISLNDIDSFDDNNYSSCQNQNKICKTKHVKESCLNCRLFGSEFFNGSLMFSQGSLSEELKETINEYGGIKNYVTHLFDVRSSNKLNRKLNTTEPGSLFNFETINPEYTFQATINGQVYITEMELKLFKSSIELIDYIGGNKSKGLSRCNIEINE